MVSNLFSIINSKASSSSTLGSLYNSMKLSLRMWNGATGEWVGVTLDGQLYRQTQYWGGQGPRPNKWEKFRLG